MNFLINDALELLSLDYEAQDLETLGGLLSHWEEITARIPELQSGDHDVFDLLTMFDDKIPAVHRVIGAADIDPSAVLALSTTLKERYETAVPEPIRKLLQPVGTFSHGRGDSDSGLITWKILEAKPATRRKLGAKKMALALSADAGLSVELEAGDPLPDVGEDDATYFRFGFNGSVKCGADVDVPFQYGSVGLASAANSRVDLDYWYAVPDVSEHQSIALFTAQYIARLANPFELDSLWKAMCQRNSRLRAVKWLTKLDHESSIDMKFGGAAALLGNDMADATFEFKASIAKARTFETFIYVDEDDGGKFLVSHLRCKKENDQGSSSAVKIGVDLKAVAGQAQSFVEPYLEKYTLLRQAYGDYLTPGSLLQGKLRGALDALIEDALGEKPELKRLALSLTGDDDQQQVLKDQLIEKISEVFDSGLGLFSRGSDDVVAEIVSRINASLPEKYGEPAGAQAEAFLKGVISLITQNLQSEVTGLLERGGKHFDKIAKQLETFHQDVGQGIDKKGKKLDKAVSGVTAFLARVDEKIEKITKALDKASRARLTVRLWDELSLRRESSADIVAKFLARDVDTRDAFKKITRGDFEEIEHLFAQPPSKLIFMDGDVTYMTQRHKGTGIEIGILELDLGKQSIFDSKVTVSVDIDGNLIINSTLSGSRKRRSVREAQKVSLLSAFDLNVARHTRNMRAKLVVSQDDKNLRLEELEDFLRTFRKVGLLSTITVSQAMTQLKDWREKSDRKHVKARVDVSLALDNESIKRLFESQRSSSDEDIVKLVTGALHDAEVLDKETIKHAARRLKGLTRVTGSTNEVFLQVQPSIPKKYGDASIRALFAAAKFGTTQDASDYFPLAESGDRKLKQAFAVHMYCKGFAVLLNTMRAVYDIHAVDTSGADLASYLDIQNQLIKLCMRRWVRVGQSFLWLPSDEASEETVAFFLALARHAGLDIRTDNDDSIMSVTLTLNDRDGGAVMVF